MRAVWNTIRHRYLGVSATVAMLLMLPIIVVATQRPTVFTGTAERNSTIFFSPTSTENSPVTISRGDNFFINVLIDPGENIISLIKLDINYDPQFMRIDTNNPISVNEEIFPDIINGPTINNNGGNMQLTLSVGENLSNAVSSRTRVATINFIAASTTINNVARISFGSESLASTVEVNSLSGRNVLSTSSPAYIKVE